MPAELWAVVAETVRQTRERSGWAVRRILGVLGLAPSSFYAGVSSSRRERRSLLPSGPFAVLREEREAVKAYARAHPELRHRELAWRMVDEDVAYLSPSTVYRVLREADLVHRWERPEQRATVRREKPGRPDERWQSDLRYVRVGGRTYYLITFVDECSRYIVHHELLRWMDGDSVSLAAQGAVETLDGGVRPVIQTDNGSGYISREFKLVLSQQGIGHHRIHPHCPEENGLIERVQRTLGEKLDEHELQTDDQTREVLKGIVRWYNQERLHSAIGFLRPIDVYRGDPERLREERRRKLAQARHQRKEENLRRRQKSLWLEADPRRAFRTLTSPGLCPG